MREHVKKKLASLAGHSAKAFLYMDIYMFLKPANSDTENGIEKSSKMSPENKHVQRKLEIWKRHFLKFTRIMWP